jgi:DNA-binding Lrp family transcriptional regulator
MDALDLKIIDALQQDGRLTNPELAERVGLSPSQCSRRRAALEDAGIIASYHARLDPKAVGLHTVVFVQVTLATHSPDNTQRFKELISRLDAVQEAYALTGAADYQVKLVLPDLAALNRLLNDVFLPHESVQQVHSLVVLDCLKQTSRLPLSQLS